MGGYATYKGLQSVSGVLSQMLQNAKAEKRYDELLQKQEDKANTDYEKKLMDTIVTNSIKQLSEGKADIYSKALGINNNSQTGTASAGTTAAGRQVIKTASPTEEYTKENYIDYNNLYKKLKSGENVIKPNLDVLKSENKDTSYILKDFEAKQINETFGTDYQAGDKLPISVLGSYLRGKQTIENTKKKNEDITQAQAFKEVREIEKLLSDPLTKKNAESNVKLMGRYKYLTDKLGIEDAVIPVEPAIQPANNETDGTIADAINGVRSLFGGKKTEPDMKLREQAQAILKQNGFDENDENNIQQIIQKLQKK